VVWPCPPQQGEDLLVLLLPRNLDAEQTLVVVRGVLLGIEGSPQHPVRRGCDEEAKPVRLVFGEIRTLVPSSGTGRARVQLREPTAR